MRCNMLCALFALLLIPVLTNAQLCGLTQDDINKMTSDLLANKEAIKEGLIAERGAISYVPIKFHIVADDNGVGRIKEDRILDLVCDLNKYYLASEIQFYISFPYNYIDDTRIYTNPRDTYSSALMRLKKVTNAINFFIVEKISDINPSLGVAGYADYDNDWVVIIKSEIGSDSHTAAHEFGHFFSLLHTHNGWDGVQYDASVHGTQVALNSPAQGVRKGNYPGQGLPVNIRNECMNKTECDTRGDYICDTPPDYGMGLLWLQSGKGCTPFNLPVKDPCGDTVRPMQNNLMSYFDGCSSWVFTSNQRDVLKASFLSTRRAYLRNNIPPVNTTPITVPINLTTPANASTTALFNPVTLDWDDVPGADFYHVELGELLPDFSIGYQSRYVTASNTVFTNLKANKRYYWRVRPLNNSQVCTPPSTKWSFTTSAVSAAREISKVSEWSVTPNPILRNASLTIHVNSNDRFKANIQVINNVGQIVRQLTGVEFSSGTNMIPVSMEQLNNGIYAVIINSAEGVLSQKVVVSE